MDREAQSVHRARHGSPRLHLQRKRKGRAAPGWEIGKNEVAITIADVQAYDRLHGESARAAQDWAETLEGAWGRRLCARADQQEPAHHRVCRRAGSEQESEAREERYLAEGCIWVFRVNGMWSRDAAVGGNLRGSSTTRAGRTAGLKSSARPSGFAPPSIRKGEELTYDYATDGEQTIPCRCRPGCPNKF